MAATDTNLDQLEDLRERSGSIRSLLRFLRKQPLGSAGLFLVLAMVLVAIFAPYISAYHPELNSFEDMLVPPGAAFVLGTDEFGRDIFTRLMYGARTALFVGLTSAFIGSTLGLVIGVASAYFGGRVDLIAQRIIDVIMAFPIIILALAIVSILGTEMHNVILAITLPFIPKCARVVRSSALAIREIPYIDAARANGFSNTRIIMRHMVPNVMAPYLIVLTAAVGQAILLEASLSFLGLGVQEPIPAWGLMLRNAQDYIESAPWVAIWPGLAITMAVFGFNMFGDAVRDSLDPRLRSQ